MRKMELSIPSKPGIIGVFRHRDYALLWAGQLVSNLGDAFHSLALLWLVKELTGSALLMGTVMAFYTIPMVVVGPVAGVVADRMEKRRLMILSDVIRAVLVGALALLYGLRLLPVEVVIIFALATGTATAFFVPAGQGSLVFLVEPDELTQANSFAMVTRQISQLVGPVLAGLVVAAWGVAPAFWADAASFMVSVIALVAMRFRSQAESGGTTLMGVWRDMKAGFGTMARHPIIRWIFPLGIVINFLLGPGPVLLPIYAEQISTLGVAALGFIQSAMGAGMLAGSILIGTAGARWPKGRTVIFGLLGIGLAVIGSGLARNLGPAIMAFGVMGLFTVTVNVPIMTLIQQETPPEQQGRIFSALMAAATAAMPVSMTVGGALGDWFGVHAVYLGMGVASSLLACSLFFIPPLRQAR